MTLIEFKNVDKTYDNKTLFSDLCLSIKQGEFITLTGTSGDGKTTLLRMINGLVSPDRGDIIINSQSIKQQNLLSLRRNIGYAIQGSGLFPHMNIADNMLYVPSLFLNWSQDQKARRLNELLEIVSLEPSLLTRFPDELSGGQQQRVGIARALAAEPKILLMDEPFGALDPSTRTQLQDAIKAIHTKLGITIVFVTHDNEEAKKLATRRLKLSDGKISVEV